MIKNITKKVAGLILGTAMILGVGISLGSTHGEAVGVRATTTEVTVSKTTNELVIENNWKVGTNNTAGTIFKSFSLDENITVSFSGSGNTASIWGTGPYDLRVYGTKDATDGSVTFTGKNDLVIKSITLEFTLQNSPTVSPSITSSTAYEVNANTQTFTLTSTKNKAGQFRITKFTCVYLVEVSSDTHFVTITSEDDNVELKDGNTLAMTALCAQGDSVKWSCENENIAVINESTGILTPIGVGSVVITATCSTDSSATATKTITVWKEPDLITDKTVAEIAAIATEEDKTTLYEITGFISNFVGTAYGNFYLKDTGSTAGASLYINGSTATESALSYSYLTKTYSFTNPRDFATNETTKNLASEYLVTIKGYIKKVDTDVFALTGIITAVQDPIVFTALDVDTKNVKTTYNLLDEFDATGLVVHAINDDLDMRELTATTDYSWSPTKFETEGTVKVTITGLGIYSGLSESFDVTVKNIGFEISPNGDDIEAQTGDASIERSVISLTGFNQTEVAYEWTSSNTSAVTITNEESATATINIVGVGESTISIYVTDYTEELTKTFKVTVIEKQILFSKVTDTSQLIPGKEVIIANSAGTYAMGSQASNNRKAITTSKNGDYIVKTDDLAIFTLLPAKDNGYAFYDETAEKMLTTASSSDNYLRTNGDYGNENTYAVVSVSTSGTTTTTSVIFKGSYTKNNLKYNSQSTIFSCYSSGQSAISIYIAVDGDPESLGDTWAKQFNATANCDSTGVRTLSSDTWSTLKTEFNNQSIPEKMAASYLDVESGTNDFKKAIENYTHCVSKYNYSPFITDRPASSNSSVNNNYNLVGNNTAVMAVVIISFVGITAIGGYLFVRKQKQY